MTRPRDVELGDCGDVDALRNSIAEPHPVPYAVSTVVSTVADSPRNSRPDLLMPPRR